LCRQDKTFTQRPAIMVEFRPGLNKGIITFGVAIARFRHACWSLYRVTKAPDDCCSGWAKD
jgi:hypothetical protein